MSNIINMRGAKEAPKKDRSTMETLLVTPEVLNQWTMPLFQRPLRVNDKVRALAEDLAHNGGCIEGVVTLGVLRSAPHVRYILDGQHRREAALISGLPEFIVDVRIGYFDTEADMGEEYVRLNSQLVKMRPDDILRGIEKSMPSLSAIRQSCSFVGYDMIRRGASSPVLGMSVALRSWLSSGKDTPVSSGISALSIAKELVPEEAAMLIRFLTIAHEAWGKEPENARLWGRLNMTLCMWLFRRMVKDYAARYNDPTRRSVIISADLFKKCLMSIAANSDYVDFLSGRAMSERDRSPCFRRIRAIFSKRIEQETGKAPKLINPPWYVSGGG